MNQKENKRIISYDDRRSISPSLEGRNPKMDKLKIDICNFIEKVNTICEEEKYPSLYDIQEYFGIKWHTTFNYYYYFKGSLYIKNREWKLKKDFIIKNIPFDAFLMSAIKFKKNIPLFVDFSYVSIKCEIINNKETMVLILNSRSDCIIKSRITYRQFIIRLVLITEDFIEFIIEDEYYLGIAQIYKIGIYASKDTQEPSSNFENSEFVAIRCTGKCDQSLADSNYESKINEGGFFPKKILNLHKHISTITEWSSVLDISYYYYTKTFYDKFKYLFNNNLREGKIYIPNKAIYWRSYEPTNISKLEDKFKYILIEYTRDFESSKSDRNINFNKFQSFKPELSFSLTLRKSFHIHKMDDIRLENVTHIMTNNFIQFIIENEYYNGLAEIHKIAFFPCEKKDYDIIRKKNGDG